MELVSHSSGGYLEMVQAMDPPLPKINGEIPLKSFKDANEIP